MALIIRVLLLVLALGLLAGVLSYFESWRVDRDQQLQLEANATDLKQLLRQFAVLPAILASDPRLGAALDTSAADIRAETILQANETLRTATERSDAAFAFLMNTSGLTIAASNFQQPISFVGRNYGFRPYFTKAMAGNTATYFAVGATTGIPGYFVSEPIKKNGKILGVIAVKLETQTLPASWNTESTIALVTDDLGVAILSTDDRLLYNRTSELDTQALKLIDEERRYTVENNGFLDTQKPNRWRYISNTGGSSAAYRVSTAPIEVEPWSLSLLTPLRSIHVRVLRDLLILSGVFLVAGLLWHAYRQQVRLAQERAKLTMRLEQLVDEKTRELEGAQQALIAESNYSMLGKMSAAINHEINQPLASLRLNLATLRQLIENASADSSSNKLTSSSAAQLEEDSIQSTVIDLDRTAKRITRVIETLRALPQQNKSGFVPVNVHHLLRDSISSLKADRKLLSKFLKLEYAEREMADVHVLGQRILLQQALLNILYNALDAITKTASPYVELRALVLGSSIALEVRDNGDGVSPSMASALFEPFESAPEKVSGMGIGLTLTRQIINDHGGTLSYHRDATTQPHAPTGLTVFVITLPLLKAATDSFDA